MQRIDTTNRSINLWGTGKDGWKDGNRSLGIVATELDAAWFNGVQEELATVIEAQGITLDPNSHTQLALAITKMIEARVGDYALDTGTANAKVVALNPVLAAYTTNFDGAFKNAVRNTGACTVNFGPSAVALVSDVGGALADGDLPANVVVFYSYVAADNKCYITQTVNSQGDARYLLQDNRTLGLVETFADPAGARCRKYYDQTSLTGMTYNGSTINAEYMTVNNTLISAGTWAGRDVTGPCWAEVMTDAGQKLYYYAASASAGVAPTWTFVWGLDLSGGIISGSGVPRSNLAGLTMSTAGGSATMSIAAGAAADSTNALMINLGAAIGKTTAAWAVGTGNGGLDAGAIANSTWYYFYLIRRPDTGVVDAVFSLSSAAPALPANYTQYRYIGAGLTNGSGQWTAFTQVGRQFYWSTPVLDFGGAGSAAAALLTCSVPRGRKVKGVFTVSVMESTTATQAIYISDPANADLAPSLTAAPLAQASAATNGTIALYTATQAECWTNTSAQIRHRELLTTSVYVSTLGWTDLADANL